MQVSQGRNGRTLVSDANLAGARPLSQFLRIAVLAGVESAVQLHIDRGDDLNARDSSGMTPLMLSAARNKAAICQLLLSAGADRDLRDAAGQTAFEIAIAAGAEAAAEILGACQAPCSSVAQVKVELDPAPESAVGLEVRPAHAASTSPQPSATDLPLAHTVVNDATDDGEFDLSGWLAEEEAAQPKIDLTVLDSARAVQTAITAHVPIDSSAEWDDIEAYLPEVALPLARADDAEGRAELRCLLLRALREGSVPVMEVQDRSANVDRSANLEAEAYLAMIINDLGAEVDERFEYSNASESFEVFVDPAETLEEEAILDEALSAIDRAASPRNEPLRIYQRELQRLRRLTAEEEIQLGKDMETAIDAALDALAAWPDGIARTLEAGAEASAGKRQLSSIWVGGGESDVMPASADRSDEGAAVVDSSADALDEDGEQPRASTKDAGDAIFAEALQRLTELVAMPRASWQEIRLALAEVRLSRHFLLELMDVAHGLAPCPAFASAMADFRKARDRMTVANLRLAFFLAKKYLYSGESLDDLTQEGNIGLLKAVDRYDWRRGFRFSTYATWWIRQQIGYHVASKARTIRIPVHIYQGLNRIERITQAFESAAGREPSFNELAERMEMLPAKLVALLRTVPEPHCIDDVPIDSMIAIDARDAYVLPDPADVVGKTQLNLAVDGLISSLSTKDRREEQILRLRFGVGIDEALTLEEIGARFEVTRERIRQVEAKALSKLRKPGRSEPFARLALGLVPGQNAFNSEGKGDQPDGADRPEAEKALSQPLVPERQATPSPRPVHPDAEDRRRPPALDRLLAQVVDLGIQVDDDKSNSGRVWVKLVDGRDSQHRKLERQLLEFGFKFLPGKGYWI